MCNNFRCSTHLCMSLSIHLCVCIWRIPYLMNHTSFNHNVWYACRKWWYLQVLFFIYFFFFRFWFFGLLLGWKGKKQPKMKNNSYIHLEPYLTNSVAYDHDFWYTCAYFPPRWWVWVCGWVYVCVCRGGVLSHFSEHLYRRDFDQIGILGGNWFFSWGWFFSVETWKLPVWKIVNTNLKQKKRYQ